MNTNKKSTFPCLVIAALTTSFAFNAQAEIVIQDLQLTDRERVSRTDFRYEFDVRVVNTGTDLEHINALISYPNPASDLSLSELSLPYLGAGEEATLEGKLVLIQNRRVRFDADAIEWSFNYSEASSLNEFEQTYSPDSAYITNEHLNFFVERGIASEEDVMAKIQNDYAQFFELIEAAEVTETENGDVLQFSDDFTDLSSNWSALPDNGSSVEVTLDVNDGRLVVTPYWNAEQDAVAVKYQQFAPIDFTNGANISYQIQADSAYVADGNTAVQLIIEDENYNPAFFAFRFLAEDGLVSVSVEDISSSSDFGYVAPGFDFTKVAAIGFQILARDKSPEIGGNISFDNVQITTPTPQAAPSLLFEDDLSNGIANWNVALDGGTQPIVNLSGAEAALVISPEWRSTNDAFTTKYQQFNPIDINDNVTVEFDVVLPESYIDDGSMALQLVIEDLNYQPGYFGYAGVGGLQGGQSITLRYENVGPASAYGYVSPSFDFSQLAGVGIQVIAGGKSSEIEGDIVIEAVRISQLADAEPVTPTSNSSVLFAASEDMAFIKAIHSDDIVSEGMSYGMMLAVMMDDQSTFNKLWKFTKTYMQNKDGSQKDFFAWRLRAQAPYTPYDINPAPDGEEYFAMALFFANNRWGSTDGIFDYKTEANEILNDMINTHTETTRLMMHPEYQQIEFTTTIFEESFTDASYHLPAFYELWALWADDDNQYWHETAQISRDFFSRAAHPVTGLFSDYSTHEGAPKVTSFNPNSHKSAFDSFRVIGNIAMDYHWFSRSEEMQRLVDLQVNFFESEINTFGNFIAVYDVDGTREPGINYRGEGRNAMNGYGATASELAFSDQMLRSLWEQQRPTGEFRYYDGFLYMFSMLHAAGEFKIHKPEEE
ncbi:glycoside hydrolase [Glaciecola sp. MH2013]|uniref:glycosyl hydrolase family 8 n=1 Tax=Glaciecola sp. MH2013 TaxID=2785524 RepID=UPI00189E0100|nr:glycosyl hydrolase family 8 [Glaciecola sp. MH2013]MBF7073470.1 glycoside hydrolase [Glaciecola sp. MH2013]